MPEWVVGGGKVKFSPGAGWSWSGWDGVVTISDPGRAASVDGHAVVLGPDLVALASELQGRKYNTPIHSDVDGCVVSATVTVDDGTLSEHVRVGGQRAATGATSGRFTAQVTPAIKQAATPIPDPVLVKTGTWAIDATGQAKATG